MAPASLRARSRTRCRSGSAAPPRPPWNARRAGARVGRPAWIRRSRWHPEVAVSQRHLQALQARLGKDPLPYVAIGDAGTIVERIRAYHAAGAHKFILRPMAADTEDMLKQTRQLIEHVLPEVAQMNRDARASA